MTSFRGVVYRFLRPAFPRPMIRYVKRNLGKRLVGVEIGVDKGDNAESILKTLDIEWLFLVDPYLAYETREGVVGTGRNQNIAWGKTYNNPKVRWIFLTSKEAISKIPFGLDFVYLDGDHGYENVKWEIEAFSLKLKPGGVLGGHNFSLYHNGVARAACEFVEGRKDIECFSDRLDWWIVKK